jgi:hypothetical protein
MEPIDIHEKVQILAQKLLQEANGDRIRALGLLVLVIEGADLEDPSHYVQLMSEVRQILVPPTESDTPPRAIQHLAGHVTWEGIQHCVRCGKVLVRNKDRHSSAFPSGYLYQIGARLSAEEVEDFEPCR